MTPTFGNNQLKDTPVTLEKWQSEARVQGRKPELDWNVSFFGPDSVWFWNKVDI